MEVIAPVFQIITGVDADSVGITTAVAASCYLAGRRRSRPSLDRLGQVLLGIRSGWVLWKALLGLAANIDSNPQWADAEHRLIDVVPAEHDLCGEPNDIAAWCVVPVAVSDARVVHLCYAGEASMADGKIAA